MKPGQDTAARAPGTREGRDCPQAYRAGARLLFARGRPQPWLWLLAAVMLLVLVRSFT